MELRAKAELEARNMFVIKAGGSLGVFDLVAVPTAWSIDEQPVCLAIQCKTNRMPSRGELREMAFLPLPPYFRRELWVWRDYRGWLKYDLVELNEQKQIEMAGVDG